MTGRVEEEEESPAEVEEVVISSRAPPLHLRQALLHHRHRPEALLKQPTPQPKKLLERLKSPSRNLHLRHHRFQIF